MNDFKAINDGLGHSVGDKALQVFSAVLRAQMSGIGFAVRYGGDEFILITKKGPKEMNAMLEKITEHINQINESGKNEFVLKFSYGMATLASDGDSENFLQTMDKSMYAVKNRLKA